MAQVSGQKGVIIIKTITRISYSFLHLLACPYASWLRYSAAVRAPTNEYAARGLALHKALEEEHRDGKDFNLSAAIDIFKKEFLRIIEDEDVFVNWPKIKKMEGEGVSYLERYYLDLRAEKFLPPTFVEEEFAIPFEGIEVVGKIDVSIVGETLEVIDYKSAGAKPDPWMLKHNLQFTCYAWATLVKHGRLPDRLIWHHLKTGERLETFRTMEDIEQLQQIIRNAVIMNQNGIKHRIFHENVCDLCEYAGTRGRKNAICDDTERERELVEAMEQAS